MASSSSVRRTSVAFARSPQPPPARELPVPSTPPRRGSARLRDHEKPHTDDPSSPSKHRPRRTLYSTTGRRASGIAQGLALPRKLRRPGGLACLLLAVLALAVYLLAGDAVAAIGRKLASGVPLLQFAKKIDVPLIPARHTYHPNGYLLVHARAKHPLLELVERAERDWRAKNARQSKTLDEAVTEYKRRYKRNPPRGFDKWWDYVQANNVRLPDEYDQIERDLRAFAALELEDFRHRALVMSERPGTFTLEIKDDTVELSGSHKTLRRATDIADLVKRFSAQVPYKVNLTFIIEDQPAVMMAYERRLRMHEMAQLGDQIGPSDFVGDDEDDGALSNYARACPPNAPLRKAELGDLLTDFSPASGQRSFVWDHLKTMDICQHPEWRQLHGLSATKGVGLGPLVPLFTFAKMSTHDDILATPLEQYWDKYDGIDPDWEQKSLNKLLWRGTTTGADFSVNFPWRLSQRARLHFMSHEKEGVREVLQTIDEAGTAKLQNVSRGELNSLYMDTSFAGAPAQCDAETCKWLANNVDFAPTQSLSDSYQYKYMIDVDGNGWSGRFHRLMSTKSLVLKSTIFPEWYADRLQPWYHYIPVKIDYSDLYDIMSFFVGGKDGVGNHDKLAGRLAENGRRWAMTHWRRVDMAAYMFRLTLEYARILNADDQDADYLG